MTSYSEPLSLRERRFAANQTIFRRANERFQRRLGAAGSELLPYVCECGHEAAMTWSRCCRTSTS